MCPVDHLADVSGVQPSLFVDSSRGRLRIAPVAGEHARMAYQDLACVVVELQFDFVVGLAHGPETDPLREVGGGYGAVLGHSVGLVDGDTYPHEELEDLGGDRRRSRDAVAALGQTESFLECSEQEDVSQCMAKPHSGSPSPSVVHQASPQLGRRAHPESVEGPLRPRCRLHSDEDTGVELLPDPRNRFEDRRLYLPHVLIESVE